MLTRTGQLALASTLAVAVLYLAALARPWSRPNRQAAALAVPLAARQRAEPVFADVPRPVHPQRPPAPTPEPPAAAPQEPAPPAVRTRKIRMCVTAYCPCAKCCGRHSDGKTASGRSIHTNGSRFVAADTRLLPFGTRLSVPGYYSAAPVSVLDRGGRIKGRRLDVFFLSHARAKRWGTRRLDVTVYEAPAR